MLIVVRSADGVSRHSLAIVRLWVSWLFEIWCRVFVGRCGRICHAGVIALCSHGGVTGLYGFPFANQNGRYGAWRIALRVGCDRGVFLAHSLRQCSGSERVGLWHVGAPAGAKS